MPDFVFRDARPEDRDEVLAFTAGTWQGGDYIPWVFDDWLNDHAGRFLVAVDSGSGKIAAIDKLSFLSPDEAWFEGLRVHPDFRGQGLAARLEKLMLDQARSRGAEVVRFLTLVDNRPVHRNGYRHGFAMRFVTRHWKWEREGHAASVQLSAPGMREATPDEAALLYDWWLRTPSFHGTGGLIHRTWSFGATSREEWVERAGRGELLVPEGAVIEGAALPPPLALVRPVEAEEEGPEWSLSLVSATGAEYGLVAAGIISLAVNREINALGGLLPDDALLYSGFKGAGFAPDADEECLALFERRFEDEGLREGSRSGHP